MKKQLCFSCGHYKAEHEGGVGRCEVSMIYRTSDGPCGCEKFEEITLERCETWINDDRIFNRTGQAMLVLRFLLEEATR